MSRPLWTSAEIAEATGGAVVGGPFDAAGVSIDTRTLQSGDLFVALAGVRDGHAFVEEALRRGAAGALVSRACRGPSVQVQDCQLALQRLGAFARDRARRARRGAVTGSVGKTSVTQAVAAGLACAGRFHASVQSYNNHIGVPLTLARMAEDTERAVFEIGMNHAGEIGPLSRLVAPEAVAITTVGPVHTENFADGEAGVARAKAEIFEGLCAGGRAILNADNRWFEVLSSEARARGAEIWAFGADGSTAGLAARLIEAAIVSEGVRIRGEVRGRPVDVRVRQTGLHWGHNGLATLLLAEALGAPLEAAIAGLEALEPIAGRGAARDIALPTGGFTLIDDSYNANPVSMAAAIRALGGRPVAGRRILAVTDMLELGPEAEGAHAEIAGLAQAARVDLVFCAGPQMSALWTALPQPMRGGYAESAEAVAEAAVAAVRPGDTVLVKGSKGSRASLIAARLAALGAQGGEGV